MEMKCILNIGKKNISILAKATQVSDVAHGPLVESYWPFSFHTNTEVVVVTLPPFKYLN
jgi:hypothetical protein